nr:NB-ARC domains-containing protein [Tanacetum cinerariifolium]
MVSRELVIILECKQIENPKHEVRIIFYDAKPDVIKKQKKSYAEAFINHEVSNGTEVDKWREALSMAADLYEYKFIDCISKYILKKLCAGPLHVGEYLVAIDFHFEKLDVSRFIGSNKVNIIGIYGKDKQLLRSHRVDEIHDMYFLNEDQSLELLRSYAFKEKESFRGFKEAAEEVVKYVQVLVDKSLITISSNNSLRMHDLIQAMASTIVCEESNMPGNQSRLWASPSEIYNILSEKKATQAVEILDIQMESSQKFDIDGTTFEQMKNLRILKLSKDDAVNFSGRMLKKLVVLNLKDCTRVRSFPSKVEIDSLQVLNLSRPSGLLLETLAL